MSLSPTRHHPAFILRERDILDVAALGDVAHLATFVAQPTPPKRAPVAEPATVGGMTTDEAAVACSAENELGQLDTKTQALRSSDAQGYTPLHLAAARGQLHVATMLLDEGGEADAETLDGYTPLMAAALNGHAGLVSLLLDRGANPGKVSRNMDTALSLASEGRHGAIIVMLDASTRSITSSTDMLAAAGAGDELFTSLRLFDALAASRASSRASAARVSHEADEDLRSVTETGDNAVIVCSKIGTLSPGHLRIVDALLKRKVLDVDAANVVGMTALMYAARANVAPFVELLLSHGANPLRSASKDEANPRTASVLATDPLLKVRLEVAEREREFNDLYATRNAVPFDERADFVAQVMSIRAKMLETKAAHAAMASGKADPRLAA